VLVVSYNCLSHKPNKPTHTNTLFAATLGYERVAIVIGFTNHHFGQNAAVSTPRLTSWSIRISEHDRDRICPSLPGQKRLR
jgi:hypothetical protein